jgi:hypothetical protein
MSAETDSEIPALAHLTAWRENHSCTLPGQPVAGDPRPGGSTSGLIGFVAQPVHDPERWRVTQA